MYSPEPISDAEKKNICEMKRIDFCPAGTNEQIEQHVHTNQTLPMSKPCATGSLTIVLLPIFIGELMYFLIITIVSVNSRLRPKDKNCVAGDLRNSLKEEVQKFVNAKDINENQGRGNENETDTAKLNAKLLDNSGVSSSSSLHNLCGKIAEFLSIGRRGCYFFPFWSPCRGWDGRPDGGKYVEFVIGDRIVGENHDDDILTINHIKKQLEESRSTRDPSTSTWDPSTSTLDPSTSTPDPSTSTPDPSTPTPVLEGAQLAIVFKAIRLRQEQIEDGWKIFLDILLFIVVNTLANFSFQYIWCIPDLWIWYLVTYTTADLVSKMPIKKFLNWMNPIASEMESVVRNLKVDLEQTAWKESAGDEVLLWLSAYFGAYQEVTDALKDGHSDLPFGIKYAHLVRLILWLLPQFLRYMGI